MISRLLRRREPRNLGRAGERAAARWLSKRGYRVLARNMHVGVGEADIVCEAPDRRTIVIVEVKTRRTRASDGFAPEVAVGAAKSRKLVQVAQSLIKQRGWTDRPVRIDVAAVTWAPRGGFEVRYLESAVALS